MTWNKSDTTKYCTCGWFERAAAEPDVPIEFDEELNEYNLVYGDRRGGYRLYFCPFCGCKAPESRRASLFEVMTRAELDRLHELTKGIRTLDDARRVLGQPDEEIENGGSAISPGSDQGPPEAIFYGRTLRYRNLSTTIMVDVHSPAQDRVSLSFCGKPRGPTG